MSTSTATTLPSSPPLPGSYDACESYLRLKKRSALTWSTRFVVLRGTELYIFYSKQDAAMRRNVVDAFTLASGRIAPRADLALELHAADGREFHARAFSRGDLARWVTAFHRLVLRREAAVAATATASAKRRCVELAVETPTATQSKQSDKRNCDRSSAFEASQQQQQVDSDDERNPVVLLPIASTNDCTAAMPPTCRRHRRVSFNGSVTVRLIPTLEQAQVPELFYSKHEVERFSAQATSLKSRTEDAVSCACRVLWRGPATLLPWRRQTV